MRAPLDVMSDGSERVRYNRPGFAVFAYRTHLSDYPEGRILCHWHDDLEFVCVRKGRIRYEVNGGEFELCAGEGLFINSDQPHGVEGYPGEDCEYFAMVLHPALLGPSAYLLENFVRPLSGKRALSLPEIDLGGRLAELRAPVRARGLRVDGGRRSRRRTFRDEPRLSRRGPAHPAHARSRAAGGGGGPALAFPAPHDRLFAGSLRGKAFRGRHRPCRRRVRQRLLRIVSQHTGQTPVGYLTRYRLRKGMEQLLNPNLSVGEVARSVGFASASYFTECFKRYLHTTPLAYRRDSGEKRVAGL